MGNCEIWSKPAPIFKDVRNLNNVGELLDLTTRKAA